MLLDPCSCPWCWGCGRLLLGLFHASAEIHSIVFFPELKRALVAPSRHFTELIIPGRKHVKLRNDILKRVAEVFVVLELAEIIIIVIKSS